MAGSVNKVILVGNLGRDPEVRRLNNGSSVVNLRVATSESWRDKTSGERQERTEWHNVVIYNENLGKVAEQYLKKGSKVYVEGQLQTRKYTDKDGVEKYSTEIVLQKFRGELTMLDGKNDGVFQVDDDAAPFVRQVEVTQGTEFRPATKGAASWVAACDSGCTLRYRFALREAADTLAEEDTAFASGDVLIAPPSTWLLRPGTELKNADFELSVEAGAGARFVTAFRPVPGDRANLYRAAIGALDSASFAAFGPLRVSEVPAGDTTVQLALAEHGLNLTAEQAEA